MCIAGLQRAQAIICRQSRAPGRYHCGMTAGRDEEWRGVACKRRARESPSLQVKGSSRCQPEGGSLGQWAMVAAAETCGGGCAVTPTWSTAHWRPGLGVLLLVSNSSGVYQS